MSKVQIVVQPTSSSTKQDRLSLVQSTAMPSASSPTCRPNFLAVAAGVDRVA
jgi:hypothetical protein